MRNSVLTPVFYLIMIFSLLGAARASAADAKAGALVIVKAEYGDLDSDKVADVTARVAAMVKDNSLNVSVNDAALGAKSSGDAAKLKVGYSIDGLYHTKTADRGQTLDISTRLVIRKAVYGDLTSARNVDVTEQVADMVASNSLSVEASNDLFSDPAGGVVKHLRVDYTLDGIQKSATVDEGQKVVVIAPKAAK